MRLSILILLIVFGQLEQLQGQKSKQKAFAREIDKTDLSRLVYKLASREMQGRKTGEEGQKLAAKYIASEFEKIGLAAVGQNDGYFQKFNLIKSSPHINQLKINGIDLKLGEDYLFEGELDMKNPENLELIFIHQNQFHQLNELDIKGKAVALFLNEDIKTRIETLNQLKDQNPKIIIGVLKSLTLKDYINKLNPIGEKRPYIKANNENSAQRSSFYMDTNGFLKVMGISEEELSSMDFTSSSNQTYPMSLDYFIKRKNEFISTENVMGIVEGSSQKEEVIIISSHYDHEGIIDGEIYFGADDNASGTASVIELAQAFQSAADAGHGPEKSILFVAFTGEEDGNLGSEYFVDNVAIDKTNIVANLNIDMIGRIAPEYDDYENYIYLVGSDKISLDLHEINEKANKKYTHLELDYTYNDTNHPERIYYRSDHWSFAKNDIPVIFYYAGEHDDYHRPTDTPDKINYPMLSKRTKLVFHTAWFLSTMDDKLAHN